MKVLLSSLLECSLDVLLQSMIQANQNDHIG